MQEWIQNWEPRFLAPTLKLLREHETLGESLTIIHQYLDRARRSLKALPESANRSGLTGLTDYLARQTDNLGICD